MDKVLLSRIDEIERQVCLALKDIAHRHHGWFAEALGIAASTFSHELENDDRNRLKLRTMLAIAHLSEKEADVFKPLATALRLTVLPVPGASAQDDNATDEQLLLRAVKELSDLINAFLKAVQPDSPGGARFTKAEMSRFKKELSDVWNVLGLIETRMGDG